MKVELVPVWLVDRLWPQLADGFHRALMKTGGDASSGDLWVQARNGSAFVFVAQDEGEIQAASIWRFETWQTGSKFRCLALYGYGMKDWLPDMRAAVEQAAGHATPVWEGRRGWGRVFPEAKERRTMFEVSS